MFRKCISKFFSAWPSHLARLALLFLSGCALFFCNYLSLVFMSTLSNFRARIKIVVVVMTTDRTTLSQERLRGRLTAEGKKSCPVKTGFCGLTSAFYYSVLNDVHSFYYRLCLLHYLVDGTVTLPIPTLTAHQSSNYCFSCEASA